MSSSNFALHAQRCRSARALLATPNAFLSAYYVRNASCVTLRSSSGVEIELRGGRGLAVSDLDIFDEVVLGDVYGLGGYRGGRLRNVLDVGAHVGIFAFWAVCNGATKVISVEPEPANYGLLKRNALRLGRGVTTLHRAVGDGSVLELVFNPSNTGGHWTQKVNREGPPSMKMGELLDRFDGEDVDLIKIDCEGRELEILSPACDLSRVRRVVVEVHDSPGEDHMRKRVMTLLSERGFQLAMISGVRNDVEGQFSVMHWAQTS